MFLLFIILCLSYRRKIIKAEFKEYLSELGLWLQREIHSSYLKYLCVVVWRWGVVTGGNYYKVSHENQDPKNAVWPDLVGVHGKQLTQAS